MTTEPMMAVRPRISIRRVLALAWAIGGHLGLALSLLRPGAVHPDSVRPTGRAADPGTARDALQVRFIRRPRPLATGRHAGARATYKPVVDDRHRVARVQPVAPAPRAAKAAAPTDRPALAVPVIHGATAAGDLRASSSEDGGFRARLRDARRAGSVRGVPGMAAGHYVPGIRLVDPRDQGVAAAMRKLQRAFGITSSHCVDVDVWRHLPPEELAARHLSPRDVDRTAERYHCSEPLGLHF